MLIDSKKIISITQLQRELTQKVRDVVSDGQALYVTRNSNVETVIIPMDEYEYLKELDEVFEYLVIGAMVEKRMKDYDSSKNISWDELKDKS